MLFRSQAVGTLAGHDGPVRSLAFGPGGRLVSGGVDRSVRIWTFADRKQILLLQGHLSLVKSVVFSPDGRWVISGSGDGTIKVWDSNSGELLKTLGGPEENEGDSGVYGVAVAPNGSRVISGGMRSIEVWSLP